MRERSRSTRYLQMCAVPARRCDACDLGSCRREAKRALSRDDCGHRPAPRHVRSRGHTFFLFREAIFESSPKCAARHDGEVQAIAVVETKLPTAVYCLPDSQVRERFCSARHDGIPLPSREVAAGVPMGIQKNWSHFQFVSLTASLRATGCKRTKPHVGARKTMLQWG